MNRIGRAVVAALLASLLVAAGADTALADSELVALTSASATSPDLVPASVNNAFESLNPARMLDTRAGSTTTDGQFAGVGPLGTRATLDLVIVGRGNVPALGVGAVAINVTAVGPTGASFAPVTPARLLDTRFSGALTAGAQRNVGVAGAAAVPVGATDVLALVSTVNASGEGSLSIWESGGASPTSPALRWGSATSTRFVVIHLGNDGQMSLKNTSISSSVDVLVDVVAYFA